jgi:CubicO group peptidase (beta-lactamase class C family)
MRFVAWIAGVIIMAATSATAAPAAAYKPVPAEEVGMSTERLKVVDAVLERHIASGGISAASVAVMRRGKLVLYKAYGKSDLEAGTPMRTDNLFQMYSSTKVVTAVAVLMLVEEGKIRLEDPVSRYIPEFKDAKVAMPKPGVTPQPRVWGVPAPDYEYDLVPATRDLTVRDLMTHVSGLGSAYPLRVSPPPPVRGPHEPLSTWVQKIAAMPLDFQPGTRWSYSGIIGCDVLARIVEIQSGQAFETFLETRIFKPLGMTDTFFHVPVEKRDRMIPVYRRADGEWRKLPPSATAVGDGDDANISGAMGLTSTAHDFVIFQQMLLNKGEYNGHRFLGPRTVELMASNHVGDLYRGEGAYAVPMYGHGFGLLVQVVLDPVNGNTGRSVGAFGFGGALGSMNWTDPKEEIAAVILLQQNNREVHIDFEKALRQAIID